jgi:siroheme synthase (precorrin-2 oxidase/ferrochelatase)
MSDNRNNLFPVFFKLEELRLLIIGAGEIGYEKLNTVLSNTPQAQVTVVAQFIKKKCVNLLLNMAMCS